MTLICWRYGRNFLSDIHWPALLPPNLFRGIHSFALLPLDFSMELFALLALEFFHHTELVAFFSDLFRAINLLPGAVSITWICCPDFSMTWICCFSS